jgi:hypothetical protein
MERTIAISAAEGLQAICQRINQGMFLRLSLCRSSHWQFGPTSKPMLTRMPARVHLSDRADHRFAGAGSRFDIKYGVMNITNCPRPVITAYSLEITHSEAYARNDSAIFGQRGNLTGLRSLGRFCRQSIWNHIEVQKTVAPPSFASVVEE